MPSKNDIAVVRELAKRVAEIAALPIQETRRTLWRKLNGLKPERPMVMIDQICWNELACDELTLRSEDAECRMYEDHFRRQLYQWEHFAADMVVEPFVSVGKAVEGYSFGLGVEEETVVGDPTNAVVGHRFINQFAHDEDVEKIQLPHVTHHSAETARRRAVAEELFDGVLEVRVSGADNFIGFWDPISTWMGVEGALYAMIDRPEFMHRLLERMTLAYEMRLDQMESQGLLCGPQTSVHCTGAYTDELPAEGYDPARPRTKDLWTAGLAQMLATVSPAMFEEFEVAYVKRLAARFGLVYYGCCDPLDRKMAQVRMIPNVRKVSMSPWVDQSLGAAEIGRQYVFSRKPSPAMLATDRFDADAVRADLTATRDICRQHGCPLEFILKDISTIRYEPRRLDDWARIAMDVAGA
ncbi:MAG: hypothetical protein FWE88_04835 [Phycisphaerae bacterium]|nr:hypothetical protein [Phycisphaerae bacterium]